MKATLHLSFDLSNIASAEQPFMAFPEQKLALAVRFQEAVLACSPNSTVAKGASHAVLEGDSGRTTVSWKAGGEFSGISISFATAVGPSRNSRSTLVLEAANGDREKVRSMVRLIRKRAANLGAVAGGGGSGKHAQRRLTSP